MQAWSATAKGRAAGPASGPSSGCGRRWRTSCARSRGGKRATTPRPGEGTGQRCPTSRMCTTRACPVKQQWCRRSTTPKSPHTPLVGRRTILPGGFWSSTTRRHGLHGQPCWLLTPPCSPLSAGQDCRQDEGAAADRRNWLREHPVGAATHRGGVYVTVTAGRRNGHLPLRVVRRSNIRRGRGICHAGLTSGFPAQEWVSGRGPLILGQRFLPTIYISEPAGPKSRTAAGTHTPRLPWSPPQPCQHPTRRLFLFTPPSLVLDYFPRVGSFRRLGWIDERLPPGRVDPPPCGPHLSHGGRELPGALPL